MNCGFGLIVLIKIWLNWNIMPMLDIQSNRGVTLCWLWKLPRHDMENRLVTFLPINGALCIKVSLIPIGENVFIKSHNFVSSLLHCAPYLLDGSAPGPTLAS